VQPNVMVIRYMVSAMANGTQLIGDDSLMEDSVDKSSECPNCGEDRVDYLVWQDDEIVQCTACKHTYNPLNYASE